MPIPNYGFLSFSPFTILAALFSVFLLFICFDYLLELCSCAFNCEDDMSGTQRSYIRIRSYS